MKTFGWLVSIALALVVGGFAFMHLSPDYNIYLVRSESMKPAINMGDLAIIGPVNGILTGEVKPGKIVTYEHGKHGKGVVTHRVLSIDGDTLVTKGDAVEDPDPWSVALSDIKGTYLFKIPYVGYVTNFARTKLGWFLVVILPAAVLVTWLVKDIVKEALRTEPEKVSGNMRPVTDWYDPWRYRRSITIRNSRGAQTDVKVRVTINTQELIWARKMQPDGSDIRFTKADKVTNIPHWIESGITTTSTVIWVRIPFVPGSDSTIYLYYGNPTAVSASDKKAVFMVNDDFKRQAAGQAMMAGAQA